MKKTSTHYAQTFVEDGYSEFTLHFKIPYKKLEASAIPDMPVYLEVLEVWRSTCMIALQERMKKCITAVYQNRHNIIASDEYSIMFRTSDNCVHQFNHQSYQAMARMCDLFDTRNWDAVMKDELGIRQLLKALYWIPMDARQASNDHPFDQLISVLEMGTLGNWID